MDQVRVAFVSTRALFREVAAELLRSLEGIELVGVVSNAAEAITLMHEKGADVVLLDQQPDLPNGQSALAELLDLSEVRVLTIKLEDHDLAVYTKRHVAEASLEDLIAEIKRAS